MTDDLPREIYAFKMLNDELGNCWQEYGSGDYDPTCFGAKYIRADLAEKPVDARVMEAVELAEITKALYSMALRKAEARNLPSADRLRSNISKFETLIRAATKQGDK